jgi:indole-3-glycerol phosphate synthase
MMDLVLKCNEVKADGSFLKAISKTGELAIIAEMKRASPSAGEIVKHYSPAKLAKAYQENGAAAISVLTEEDHFQGSLDHLKEAKKAARLPILRKDFIVDPYQIYEAKLAGASAVLLIIAILSADEYSELLKAATSLEMDALVEVHSSRELDQALGQSPQSPKIIGINNRNLKDLTVDLETTFDLLQEIPKGVRVVSESGIQTPETIRELKKKGVAAALVGEHLLKSKDPGAALKALVQAGKK